MLTHEQWYEFLERQASNIDSLDQAIEEQHSKGNSTVYARSVLADMVQEHRAALSRAPLDVLFDLGRESAFTAHL